MRPSLVALVYALLLPFAVTACTLAEGGDEACDDDEDNDNDGRIDCADPGCALASVCSPCGDGELDDAEACDDGNRKDGDGCSARCAIEGCGDGVREGDEACDDGNLVAGDGCSARCQIDRCGDAVLQPGLEEQCDDGNTVSGDGCSRYCRAELDVTCGNLRFDPLEECDDGDRESGDGCSAMCRAEFCGDGIVQPTLFEECEGSRADDGTLCSNCRLVRCGNGVLDLNEQCDDGNMSDGDGCTSFCALERCGDFFVQAGEQCDDGNVQSGDGCSTTCRTESCGDGVLQPRLGELCDGGEDCSAQCLLGHACSGAVCFDVDVRTASLAARSVARVRLVERDVLDLASVQVGFVERHGVEPVTVEQPSYPSAPILVAALDRDGDGRDEIAAADFNARLTAHDPLGPFLGDAPLAPDFRFVLPLDLRTGALFDDARVADAAVVSQTGVVLVVNELGGDQAAGWITLSPASTRAALAPVADGVGVVVVAAGRTLQVLRVTRSGDALELELVESVDAGGLVGDLAVADLAADGARELLVLRQAPDEIVSWPLPSGDIEAPWLGAPAVLAAAPGASLLSVGDVDDDGAVDLVTVRTDATFTVLRAADAFAAGPALPTPHAPSRAVIGDLDRDGDADLAVAGGFFQRQLVLYRGE